MNTRLYYAVEFTILIVIFSIIPLPELTLPSGSSMESIISPSHIAGYIICGYLWLKALGLTRRYIIVVSILAPLTEIVQLPLPYRCACISDVMSNIIELGNCFFLAGFS